MLLDRKVSLFQGFRTAHLPVRICESGEASLRVDVGSQKPWDCPSVSNGGAYATRSRTQDGDKPMTAPCRMLPIPHAPKCHHF